MWITPEKFTVRLGGNYFINTPNLIVVKGENLFRLKRREEDGLLAIDFDIYAADGSKIATIRNGNIVQGDATRYQFKKEVHRYWITDRTTGRVLCDVRKAAKAVDGSELEVSVDLYTKQCLHIVAGPDATNICGLKAGGNRIVDCSAGFVID